MKDLGSKLFWFKAAPLLVALVFSVGCNFVKTKSKTPTLLKTENASQAELLKEIDRFARVDSMRAKMYLKFEDNSFAEFGSKEVYRQADGEVVVQRPGKILLKCRCLYQVGCGAMTSDGGTFRIAILRTAGREE
jgi:hypothetical protein